MSTDLEALRAELKAEEEKREVLRLSAEVEALRKEQKALEKKNSREKPNNNKKRTGTDHADTDHQAKKIKKDTQNPRVDKARQALAGLPTTSTEIVTHTEKKPKDKRWEALVKLTKEHPKTIEYCTKTDMTGWARAAPCGEWCKDLSHAYAIDCEMCICEDPHTKKRTNRELVRFSIIDASDPKTSIEAARDASSHDVVLDSLVKPSLPVVDYVTRIHGIDGQQLESVTFQRMHAQAALKMLCCDCCVLIGHAIHNDLSALQFAHDCIVDTSLLYRAILPGNTTETSDVQHMSPALRDVAAAVAPEPVKLDLKRRQHNSTVDARTAFLCADFLLSLKAPHEIPYAVQRGAGSNGTAANQHIFIHRIPLDYANPDLIKKSFEDSTGLRVDSILNFTPGTPYSKLTLVFRTPQHATLAFESLGPRSDDDKAGKPQKKLFLTSFDQNPSSSSQQQQQQNLLANPDIIPNSHKPNKHGPYCKVRMA